MRETKESAKAFLVPTRILTNGEFDPPPKTDGQRRVEQRTLDLAASFCRSHGMDRREFLHSTAGMAAVFLAMNAVYSSCFDVAEAEASEPGRADERTADLADQLMFDNQLHFVHDDFSFQGLLDLRAYASEHWNPEIMGEERSLKKIRFSNFLREVFLQSDTKSACSAEPRGPQGELVSLERSDGSRQRSGERHCRLPTHALPLGYRAGTTRMDPRDRPSDQ